MDTRHQAASNSKPNGVGFFVRLVRPVPAWAVGIDGVLERAGIQHGPDLPPNGLLRAVLLSWQGGAQGLAAAVEGARGVDPHAPLVVLGPRYDPEVVVAALKAGARGFVHAAMPPDQIVRALGAASRGELAVPRNLLGYLLADDESAATGALSSRQREILELVAEGLSNAQIAQRLFLSESTVKQHLHAAYAVLGVRNRREATRVMRKARGG